MNEPASPASQNTDDSEGLRFSVGSLNSLAQAARAQSSREQSVTVPSEVSEKVRELL